VAVALSDIDHKRMNDTLGHAVGDQVIQRVGQSLQSCTRDGDLIARCGVLCGNAEGARKFAESIAALQTEAGPIISSGGVAGVARGARASKRFTHVESRSLLFSVRGSAVSGELFGQRFEQLDGPLPSILAAVLAVCVAGMLVEQHRRAFAGCSQLYRGDR